MQQTKKSKTFGQALMHHGMQHFFLGGLLDTIGGGIGDVVGGLSSGIGAFAKPLLGGIGNLVGGAYSGLTKGIVADPNQFQAQALNFPTVNYGASMQDALGQQGQGYDRFLQDRSNQNALQGVLMDQYQGGGGPSPAQAMLNKATGQNIQAQGALMAGTRGGGTNVGLLAKQAAQTGSQLQQQAAQDSATLKANEQTALRQALQNQQALTGGANLEQQGISGKLFSDSSHGFNEQNKNATQNYNNAQELNAGVAKQNAEMTNDLRKGFLNAAGGAGMALLKHSGGEIPHHLKGIADVMYPNHVYEGTGRVPGHVMQRGVDKESYDKIPILAEPGEVVLPKHIAQSKDAPNKAKLFMQHLMDKKERGSYERIAKSKRGRK